jgi:hypothetical protein
MLGHSKRRRTNVAWDQAVSHSGQVELSQSFVTTSSAVRNSRLRSALCEMAHADVTPLHERVERLLVLAAHSRAAAHHETADKLTALVAELLIEIAKKKPRTRTAGHNAAHRGDIALNRPVEAAAIERIG